MTQNMIRADPNLRLFEQRLGEFDPGSQFRRLTLETRRDFVLNSNIGLVPASSLIPDETQDSDVSIRSFGAGNGRLIPFDKAGEIREVEVENVDSDGDFVLAGFFDQDALDDVVVLVVGRLVDALGA